MGLCSILMGLRLMSEYLGEGVGLVSESLMKTLSLLLLERRGMSSLMPSLVLGLLPLLRLFSRELEDLELRSHAPLLRFPPFFLALVANDLVALLGDEVSATAPLWL